MLLLITCRDLEVADRRMTTAIKLVLAQAFVAGATSLVHQLMRHRVRYRRPFPEARPVHAASSSWLAASAGTARPRGYSRFCLVQRWLWCTGLASHTRHMPSPETGHACRGPWGRSGPPDRAPADPQSPRGTPAS